MTKLYIMHVQYVCCIGIAIVLVTSSNNNLHEGIMRHKYFFPVNFSFYENKTDEKLIDLQKKKFPGPLLCV